MKTAVLLFVVTILNKILIIDDVHISPGFSVTLTTHRERDISGSYDSVSVRVEVQCLVCKVNGWPF